MVSIHHRPIKRFHLDGNIYDESALWRLRLEYQKLLESEMRLSGYVPRLDINNDFTVSYNEQKEYFEFKLSSYGVYVGKKKSEWIIGVDETKVIFTQASKSSEYSQEAA
jgi:hypothetical protein